MQLWEIAIIGHFLFFSKYCSDAMSVITVINVINFMCLSLKQMSTFTRSMHLSTNNPARTHSSLRRKRAKEINRDKKIDYVDYSDYADAVDDTEG